MQTGLAHPHLRLPQQVVGLETQEQRLEQPLHAPDGSERAADVIEKDESPTRLEHPDHLGHALSVVRNAA